MTLTLKGLAIVVVVVVSLVIGGLAVVVSNVPPADSAELTADEKALEFLSSVVGLDLAKYTLTSPTPPPDRATYSYPPELCGIVKQETPSFNFEADGSKISVMSIFYNGQMSFFKINNNIGSAFFSAPPTLSGDYIYSEPPAADLLSQAKTILQRYQAYAAQVYDTDNSYLESMQNILNSVNDLSPTNVTVGNVNFQVSENENRTLIQWIYTENGVIMNYKRVALAFRNNAFESIIDNWRIYSVSGPSVINAEQAYKIALEAAQNYEFRVGHEDGTVTIATIPDLSNAFYQTFFGMAPYRHGTLIDRLQNRTLSPPTRDPLTLYPSWAFYFYFPGEKIAGCEGIQVGIWGDTGEIRDCSEFGYYGTSDPTNEEDT